jgi:hypothetical protein
VTLGCPAPILRVLVQLCGGTDDHPVAALHVAYRLDQCI